MTAEIKYTPRFLKLDANSSLEESKLAYDEMAPCWEKVNTQETFIQGSVVGWQGLGHELRRERGSSLVLMTSWGCFTRVPLLIHSCKTAISSVTCTLGFPCGCFGDCVRVWERLFNTSLQATHYHITYPSHAMHERPSSLVWKFENSTHSTRCPILRSLLCFTWSPNVQYLSFL